MSEKNSQSKATIKERLKEETRSAIIDEAIKAFSELGYHGMKIAAVAREAGVANGTFYLHFKDKEALYSEIVSMANSKLGSGIFAAHNFNGGKGDTDRAELQAVMDFAENHSDLMRIALDTSAPAAQSNTDLLAPLINIRISELEKGIKDGQIYSGIHPEIGARAEMSMALSVIQWWTNNRGKATKEQVLDTLCHIRRSWSAMEASTDDIDSLLSQWDSRL